MAIDEHQVEHFAARKHGNVAHGNLPAQGLVGTQEQLLAGLAPRVKRARYLRAAERTIRQQTTVFARKRHALRNALVNYINADLGQTINIGLARAEVAALDGVVEKTIDAVAVVLVVLGRVDSTLGGDTGGAARTVLIAEGLYLVA